MTHVDVALMLVFGMIFAGMLMIAVVLLSWLQGTRQPRPPSEHLEALRPALRKADR
jgi:hypothetical protein